MPSPPNGIPAPESRTAPSAFLLFNAGSGRAFQQQQFTMDRAGLAFTFKRLHLLLPYGTVQIRIRTASSVGRRLGSTAARPFGGTKPDNGGFGVGLYWPS